MDTHMQKKFFNPYFVLYIKINAKYFRNLNTKPITRKILENDKGETFDILGKANVF